MNIQKDTNAWICPKLSNTHIVILLNKIFVKCNMIVLGVELNA